MPTNNKEASIAVRFEPIDGGWKQVSTAKGTFERLQEFGYVIDAAGRRTLANCEGGFGITKDSLSVYFERGVECLLYVSSIDSRGAVLALRFEDVERLPKGSELKQAK